MSNPELTPEQETEADAALGDAQIKIPLVALTGCGLRIDKFPDGNQMLVIGPVAFGLPLSPENVQWLNQNLTGSSVIIAPAMAIPKTRGH